MTKFGNNSVFGLRGISFKSQAERNHALWLESEKQGKRIKDWEYEKSYALYAAENVDHPEGVQDGIEIGRHKPDFTVKLNDDRVEIHEIKGGQATKTEAWQMRRKIFKANYPHIAYKVFDGIIRVRAGRVIQFD